MMDIAKSETFKNFIILNKALLFLIKLSKTAVQSVPNNAKKQHNDRASLLIHFQTWHQKLMNSLPDISDCFEVTFLREPRNQQKLDVSESMWINKLVAEININKTIIPKYH